MLSVSASETASATQPTIRLVVILMAVTVAKSLVTVNFHSIHVVLECKPTPVLIPGLR